MDLVKLSWVLDVNVVGVQRVTVTLLPLVEQGTQKKINTSSALGSFAYVPHIVAMPTDAYIISKTALNLLTVRYAHQYADNGFTTVAISPGWLKTDMGSRNADISAEVGVTGVKRRDLEIGKEQKGHFINIKVSKTDEMRW